MLRRIGRFLDNHLGRIEVVVIIATLCYLIGMALILYYGLQDG